MEVALTALDSFLPVVALPVVVKPAVPDGKQENESFL